MALQKLTTNLNKISTLDNVIRDQASDVKAAFDHDVNVIKDYINDTLTEGIDDLNGENVKLTGDQQIDGVKTFSSSPIVPNPTTNYQTAPKKYVDDTMNTHKSSNDHDGRYYTESEMSSTTDGSSGADKLGVTSIPTLPGNTAQSVLESIKERFDDIGTTNPNVELSNSHYGSNGNTYASIGARCDSIDSQLAQKANQTDVTNNLALKTDKATSDNLQQQINSVASGSPKGVFATVSALTTAFPTGNTNIYIVKNPLGDNNDYWYYWSGSAWTIGNAFQSTINADKSIAARKLDFTDIKTQYLLTANRNAAKGYYHGTTTISSSSNFSAVTAFPGIRILEGITYSYEHIYGYFGAIKWDDGTTINITESISDDLAGSFTAAQNGYIYISVSTSLIAKAMFVSSDYVPSAYIEGDYAQKMNNVYGMPIESTDYLKKLYQYLIPANATNGYYYNNGALSKTANAECSTFAPIKIYKGVTYTYYKLYAYFCTITYEGDTKVALSSDANATAGSFTATSNGYIYITCTTTDIGAAQFVNNTKIFDQYHEGYVGVSMPQLLVENDVASMKASGMGNKIITVKTDGTGDYTSVVSAVAFVNSLNNIGCDIYIYDGTYDLLDELGGQTFLNSVSHTGTFAERQGLRLDRDNINIYGIGRVILNYQLPDTVTYEQSRCTSGLNLYKTNKIENIEIVVKNCRYAVHDETNGGNPYIKRYIKNCRFTHLGNVAGLWAYPSVYGGGAGGGSQYDFINSQFITNVYGQAWSFHTNSNEKPSHFNVDGCVGIVNNSSGYSFSCSYYGTGQEGRTIFNIKNCTGNGIVYKTAETAGSTDHIDVYVNGYNQIAA